MNQATNPLEFPNGPPELTINLHDGSDEQVSIIIVHQDRPEYLNICLQSIHVCSSLNNYEVIVVDNASGKETQEFLDVLQEEGIKIVRNSTNEFWSAACNQGVKVAHPNSKYFIFLHCDTVILNPAWIDILVNIAESKGSGMVGCQLQQYYIQKQKVNFLQEWCLLISRQCFEDVGPWPEELPLVGMSFILTYRAQMRGYQVQTVGNNIVHHYRQFAIDTSEYERIAEKAMATVGKLMLQAQQK